MRPGAAAFAAMRAYEQRQASEGRPPQHQLAKEILAGIVGGEVGASLKRIIIECCFPIIRQGVHTSSRCH